MFQEQLEKGLFTFYWEQTHSDRRGEKQREDHPAHRSQMIDPTCLLSGHETPMEEKQPSLPLAKSLKQSHSVKKHQSYLFFQVEKENKDVLIPHRVTLDPLIQQANIKTPREERKGRQLREGGKMKTLEKQEKEQQGQVSSRVEKLMLADETVECHKKTLVIQQALQGQSSSVSTLRPGKVRKATIRESHSKETLLAGKFPIIKTGAQSSRPPMLLGHPKKLRKVKQNLLLERICLKKGQSSVVNIGMCSVDDYKERWKKRKEEFLSMLSRSDARERM